MASGLTRRAALASPWAAGTWLAACRSGEADTPLAGAWLGTSHAVGHRLQDGAAGSTSTAGGTVQHCDVAIVGGGVAGLAAARVLMRAGINNIRLFELENVAGGNARAHQMGGMACPQGAHYLPMPGPEATEVTELLFELGLMRTEFGRTVANERHLSHSPQERLWLDGEWVDGLLPPAMPGSKRLAQYRLFAQRLTAVSQGLRFAIPSHRVPWADGHAALDAIAFADWLQAQGLDDPALRWYLDYICRDDYGADSRSVSAWAGIHYFASRHGFSAPGDDESSDRHGVFTWPQGNAFLTQRLADPLGERLLTNRMVRRAEVQRHGVTLEVLHAATGASQRWLAKQLVLAVPLHVAARVLTTPPPALQAAAAQVLHAPWLVANLQLSEPLTDKPGAPPSWDNVLLDLAGPASPFSASLGYVDAMHQSLRPAPGPTVLTVYWALGGGGRATASQQRQALLDQPWNAWAQRVMADLSRAHPDLAAKTVRMDLTRYGHAMAVPVPGFRSSAALQAMRTARASMRLHFAHSDLAAYSVFEEAFTLGHEAGAAAASALRA